MPERISNKIARSGKDVVSLTRPLQKAFWISVLVVLLIGLLDLLGWITGITWLKSAGPQESMRVITALCFILVSLSLLIIYAERPVFIRIKFPVISGVFLIIVSLLTIFCWLYVNATGYEASMTTYPVMDFFLAPSARMALLSGVIFFLFGTILIILTSDGVIASNIAHILCFPASVVGYLVPVSYFLKVSSIHQFLGTSVALNTGIALCAVCFAIYIMRPRTWLMKVFTSHYSGGIMARRMLPWLVLLPVIIGWLRIYGEHSELFVSEVGVLLVALTYTCSFVFIVWLTGRSVNFADRKREIANEALRKSYADLEEKVRERTSELISLNTALDIEVNERKKAQETVEMERKRTNDLLEMMPAYLILLTPDYRVSYANKYFREHFGEDNGMRCYEYLFNRNEPCEVCETFRALKENKPITWEWTGPNGRNYSIYDFPFSDIDGTTLIMEMGIDITDLKLAEDKLKTLNALLEQRVMERTDELSVSEQRYRLLVDSIPDTSIQLFDHDHRFLIAGGGEIDKNGIDRSKVEGHTLTETYSPEVARLFGPLYDKALKGKATNFEHEYGQYTYLQQVIPVYNYNGNIDSGMVISTNITERKRAEKQLEKYSQRLKILSDTSSQLLESRNPQQLINELCTRVMKFLDCDLFFNYFMDERSGKLHLNSYEGIPLRTARKIEWLELGSAICGCVAMDSRRIIAENILETPDTKTDLVKSFGIKAYACHPLMAGEKVIGTLSFGTKSRINFSEDDLSLMKTVADEVSMALGRIKQEDALRESENRFRTIAESLPAQISISRKSDATIIFTNESYNRTFGYRKEELTGKKAPELFYDPEERGEMIRIINEQGSLRNYEVKVKRADGTPFWLMASIQPISFGGEPALLGVSIDITDHKKALEELSKLNRTLNSLGKSSQAMMHAANEKHYLNEVCRIIIEDCGHSMVWIGYAQNDRSKSVRPVAHAGFDQSYIDQLKVTWDNTERGRGPTGTAIRTGKLSICKNMLNDPSFGPWRKEALKRGYASSIVLPLITDGKPFGALSIYSKEVDPFSEKEIKLLSDLADDLAYGISNIRLTESEREASKVIKESEEKYRLLFNRMTEGFALHEMILDAKGKPFDYRFLSINPAFENHTGLIAENLIGRRATEVLPGSVDYWVDLYGKVAMTGESIEFENYQPDINRYFRISAFSPGKGYFAIILDNITDRVLAEKELRQTKDYLENLINYANAPIVVWNPETEIVLFNHAFEHLTGYLSSEVQGKKLHFLFPEYSLEESNAKITSALTENWKTIDIPILTKNKEIRTVLWNSANIYDVDNKTVISTIAQGNDITERIAAERLVKESKEKLDIALENGKIGTWEWDLRTRVFKVDERMERILGMNSGTFENTLDAFEKFIYEEDLAHVRIAFRDALADATPLDTIFRVIHDNHEINHISSKALVEKDLNGNNIKISGVCFDITEMKKGAEKALFILNENLLRSNKELEQFAYVASHDLQEPLRMVSSFTQLLSQRYKDKLDQDAQDFIRFAVEGAGRMQILINDLLDYSRIETKGKKFADVDMHYVLGQVINNLKLTIQEKHALVSNDDLPEVVADSGQMVQLLQNLIGNSLKFCKNPPRVHISVVEEKGHYLFSVKDNGIGIEAQYFERIFQIFQRLHQKEEYGGTGIGLAICKRIIDRHGGRIWVESRYGKGSVFYFTILKKFKIDNNEKFRSKVD